MALGLSTGSGENGAFLPLVKFDARSGRMSISDRQQGTNGWESVETDITRQQPAFAVDFGSIETGYIEYSKPPVFALAPLGSGMPAKPSEGARQGFRVKLYGKALGGLREFSTTSKAVLGAIDELHTLFEKAPEAAAGKIPVVKLVDSKPIQTTTPQGKTTNYAPVFELVTWADRPEDILGPRTVPAPTAKQAAPAPAPKAEKPAGGGKHELSQDIPF